MFNFEIGNSRNKVPALAISAGPMTKTKFRSANILQVCVSHPSKPQALTAVQSQKRRQHSILRQTLEAMLPRSAGYQPNTFTKQALDGMY